MRAVIQRTRHSKVLVDNEPKGEINHGLVVLLGVKKDDTKKDAEYIMEKIINLRIFADDEEKMNLSLKDINGEILLISQFTLYGDVRKGRRPSFTDAELPDKALEMFNYFVTLLEKKGIEVQKGVFGADMQLIIENDGPVTILLDSERQF